MFVYVKYYQDGSCIILCNNEDWLRYHLAKGYPVPAPIPLNLLEKKEAFHVISNGNQRFQQAKYDLMQKYNSDQAVDFIIKGNNFYEVICFAFPVGYQDAINAIVNNLDAFKQFTAHFKERAASLLDKAEENKVILPSHMTGIDFSLTMSQTIANEQTIQVQDRIKAAFNKTLSSRQVDVLYHTVKGKTANDTAIHMGLSRRTIEHYLVDIKNKIGVTSKSELIQVSIDYLKDLI